MEQNWKGTRLIAAGTATAFRKNADDQTVTLRGKAIEIPTLYYFFWKQFREPCLYEDAKASFVETGLPGEIFDACLGELTELGLMAEAPRENAYDLD